MAMHARLSRVPFFVPLPHVTAVAQEAAGSDELTVLDSVLAVDPEGAALDK